MPALLFGSIGTLVESSEIQRSSFNTAFERHGLDWHWDREDYLQMLESSGGRQRIADFAAARGDDIDPATVHATKSEVFREKLIEDGTSPRPGVIETIKAAHGRGVTVGLVTTTSTDNVEAVLRALSPSLSATDFAVIVDVATAAAPKPDPAAYLHALTALDEKPDRAIAIEDNIGGISSATAAGLRVIAFPNANTTGHDFSAATERVERLDDGALLSDLTRS
ncbi:MULTISPECIES: HAD-IA family hydrolase [unclassified Pseudonocardia]|uniref:HAD family hydrolase n=1 Tax=unclassified Pseudonocardia TaxID=2619320 RepID=UPI0001FFDDA8|nr:HAD-IA family hydrolase [Pseudonocardia sp. Ae707_Ps1]OLM09145.1 Hypothetical protein Ae707Ps1_6092 [Pseudonocardia sp. Ae707_Ps1]